MRAKQKLKSILLLLTAFIIGTTLSLSAVYGYDQGQLNAGKAQLCQMLNDRPAMREFVQPGDKLWQWTIRQFAGEAAGVPIKWSTTKLDKTGEYIAENEYPTERRPGYIRIRKTDAKGAPLSADTLWSSFVFECYNIGNGAKFQQVYIKALHSSCNEDQWIEDNTRIEYESYKKTRQFFDEVIEPMARQRNLKVDGRLWGKTVPATYQEWIANYKNRDEYPWSYWGHFYKNTVMPYRQKLKSNK